MRIKLILSILIIIFLISPASYAIDGYFQLEYKPSFRGYETNVKDHLVATLYLYEEFLGDKLRIAGKFDSTLLDIKSKAGYMPAGSPINQQYSLKVSYKLNKRFQIYVDNWCNHYFAQSKSFSMPHDRWGVSYGVRYNFK